MKTLLLIGSILLLAGCGQYKTGDSYRLDSLKHVDSLKEIAIQSADSNKMEDSARMAMQDTKPAEPVKHSYHAEGPPPPGTELGDLKLYYEKPDISLRDVINGGFTINCSIANNNEGIVYQDAQVEVFYFSKTGTLIDTDKSTNYDIYTYGTLTRFKLHGRDVDQAATIDVQLLGATVR